MKKLALLLFITAAYQSFGQDKTLLFPSQNDTVNSSDSIQPLNFDSKITHKIRWGGDWDSDGEIKDNNFDDLVHIEIIG